MSDSERATRKIHAAQIVQALPDGVFVVDQKNRVLCWNSMAEHISGYSVDEMLGQQCPEGLLQNITISAPNNCEGNRRAQEYLNDGERREMVTYIRHRDGHLVPVLVKLSPITQGNAVIATVAQLSDMTPRSTQEPRTNSTPEKGGWVDPLTLLPSRLASTAQLRDCFERWKLTGERFSVMLFSVRHTHELEQQHGAKVMERMFAAVAKTLSGAVRQNDFVGRWMDEQFITLLPHCAQPQARNAGRRLVALLQQTTVGHDGALVTAQVEFAVTSVRANDTPAVLLERLYQELKRKEQGDQVSGRRLISFHQQRPM